MSAGDLVSRSYFMVAEDLKCPYCFWDEIFSSQLELEWHVLKKHGNSVFKSMLKNGNDIATSRWTRTSIDYGDDNWFDGKRFKLLGDDGFSAMLPPHSRVNFVENSFNDYFGFHGSLSGLKFSDRLERKNGKSREKRAGISSTRCLGVPENLESKKKCEPLFGLDELQKYITEVENFKAVGKEATGLGFKKIQSDMNEPENIKMIDRTEHSFGGNDAKSHINEPKNFKILEETKSCMSVKSTPRYINEQGNLSSLDKSEPSVSTNNTQSFINELNNLKIVEKCEPCVGSRGPQSCGNELENLTTVQKNGFSLGLDKGTDGECSQSYVDDKPFGGTSLAESRKKRDPITEPVIASKNIGRSYELGRNESHETHKQQMGSCRKHCTCNYSDSSMSQCIANESFSTVGWYCTSDEIDCRNVGVANNDNDKRVNHKCRGGKVAEFDKDDAVIDKVKVPKNKLRKKAAICDRKSIKSAHSPGGGTRLGQGREIHHAKKVDSGTKLDEITTVCNEIHEKGVMTIKDDMTLSKGIQAVPDMLRKEGRSVENEGDVSITKCSNDKLKNKTAIYEKGVTKGASCTADAILSSHDQSREETYIKGTNTDREAHDVSTLCSDSQENKTVPTKEILGLSSGMQNLPGFQQSGGCCVKIGDISIRFGEKVVNKQEEKVQTMSYKEEISEIREEIKDLTDRLSINYSNSESDGVMVGRVEKVNEIPAGGMQKLNGELMNELKKALMEANNMQVVAGKWRSKCLEIESQLKKVEEDAMKSKAECQNLVIEKGKLEEVLSAADEKLVEFWSEVSNISKEVLDEKEKIKFLEGLLKEKEQAIEEMVNCDTKEWHSVCENIELKNGNSSDLIEDRNVSHSLSRSLSCMSRLARWKYAKKAGMSKKKTMKLIIDELDEEIVELGRKLSKEKKKFTLLMLFKKERIRELEMYKEKVAKDAKTLQNIQRELDVVKDNSGKEQRQLERLAQKLTNEKGVLSQQNENFSKELCILKEEIRKAAWSLKFADSYNAEMEEKLHKYVSLVKQKLEEERKKSQEAVKLVCIESEKKDKLLKGLKVELIAERKERRHLKERYEENFRKLYANEGDRKSKEMKCKGHLTPNIGSIAESVTGNFTSILSQYGNGEASKLKLMEAVCDLGSQISKVVSRKEEESCEGSRKASSIKCTGDRRREKAEISNEKCQCRGELSLFESKFGKLEHELVLMREKYGKLSEECTTKKQNEKEAETKIKKLHEENQKMIMELCKVNKFMSDDEAILDLKNDYANVKEENIKLKKAAAEALNLLESIKNEKEPSQKVFGKLLQKKHSVEDTLRQFTERKGLYQEHGSLLVEEQALNKSEKEVKSEEGNTRRRHENLKTSLHNRLKINNEPEYGRYPGQEVSLLKNEDGVEAKKNKFKKVCSDGVISHVEGMEELKKQHGSLEDRHITVSGTSVNALNAKNVAEKILREKGYEMDRLLAGRRESLQELDKRSLELNSTIEQFNNVLLKNEELKKLENECRENSDALEKYREIMRLRGSIMGLREKLEEERSSNDRIFRAKEEELKMRMEEIKELREKLIELSEMYEHTDGKVKELKSNIKLDFTDGEEFERRVRNANLSVEALRSEGQGFRVGLDGQEARLEQMVNEMVQLEKEKRELGLLISKYKVNLVNLDRKVELQMKKSQDRDTAMGHMIKGFEDEWKCFEEKVPGIASGTNTFQQELKELVLDKGLIGNDAMGGQTHLKREQNPDHSKFDSFVKRVAYDCATSKNKTSGNQIPCNVDMDHQEIKGQKVHVQQPFHDAGLGDKDERRDAELDKSIENLEFDFDFEESEFGTDTSQPNVVTKGGACNSEVDKGSISGREKLQDENHGKEALRSKEKPYLGSLLKDNAGSDNEFGGASVTGGNQLRKKKLTQFVPNL